MRLVDPPLAFFDVVAAVNDERTLAENLMRSPILQRPDVRLHLQRGYRSATRAFEAALACCVHDIVVFVHQDVYLPDGWELRLADAIGGLQETDPDWAVLGIYGVSPLGEQVGCIWSSGLNAVFGRSFDSPAPVESIDEVLIVLRRSSGVGFDGALPGYHLYATDLVQTALSTGHGAYVIHAPVVHNSRPVLYLGRDYFDAYDHVARKWRHRLPIHNHVTQIVAPGAAYLRLRLRQRFNAWRYAGIDREALRSGHDCVGLARRLGFE